jgi:hypothetical protein
MDLFMSDRAHESFLRFKSQNLLSENSTVQEDEWTASTSFVEVVPIFILLKDLICKNF